MPKPRAITLIAKPLLLSNHCETIFAQPSIKEPWPKNLKKPNPTVNIKKLDAAPKNMHDIPKIILIIIKLDLDPYLSISFPICGSKNAATRVARPYADAIEAVEISKSLLIGPTKTLKV